METIQAQEERQFEALIQGLIDDDFGSCDDFFTPGDVLGLRNTLLDLVKAGQMKVAGFGNKLDYKLNDLVRSDKIHWIEAQSINPFESLYLKKVWRLIAHLNRTCYTSINNFESHYSSYEQKRFYKKHFDQFKTEKGRKFSIILYLNEDWKNEDGGLLSLYPVGRLQRDLAPIGGRLVFFRSDEMEHEVHPSFTRERNSIAGWMKG